MEKFKHYHLRDGIDLSVTMGDNPVGCITQRILADCRDLTDEVIVKACVECAKEAGVTDLYLLDRQFVIEALKEKLEREKAAPLVPRRYTEYNEKLERYVVPEKFNPNTNKTVTFNGYADCGNDLEPRIVCVFGEVIDRLAYYENREEAKQ